MNKIYYLTAIFIMLFIATEYSRSAEPVANSRITFKAKEGATYTAQTNERGQFTVNFLDEDSDGDIVVDEFSMSVGTVKFFAKGQTARFTKSSKSQSSKTKSSTAQDHNSSRSNKTASAIEPIKTETKISKSKVVLCCDSCDCDDKDIDKVIITFTIDNGSIQGMAVNQKGTPGGSVKKGNK